MIEKPVLYHIPVCPFSQRVEILLELKGLTGAVDFAVVDITKPRDPALLAKTRGTTALPIVELENGAIIKESLVILRYFEERFPEPHVAAADPYRRAVENMLIALEGPFTTAGYAMVMNRNRDDRQRFAEGMDREWGRVDDFLTWQAPYRDFLFERFGLAEAVFTPMFRRFAFLSYYEHYEVPERFGRARAWREACLDHPAAQQVSDEEIVKLYYDYALGKGNGALAEGRRVSSFRFEPHWRNRPWPPRDKWKPASDAQLGLE